jgi:hypothetical protein
MKHACVSFHGKTGPYLSPHHETTKQSTGGAKTIKCEHLALVNDRCSTSKAAGMLFVFPVSLQRPRKSLTKVEESHMALSQSLRRV